MNSKTTNNRTFIRRSLASLALALTVGGSAVLAPAAGAETLVPPPPPGAGELPQPPQEEAVPSVTSTPPATETLASSAPDAAAVPVTPQASSPEAPRVVRARLAGQGHSLVLSLGCSSGGTVALRGGTPHRFACHGGKAGATLSLGARREVGAGGLRLLVLLRTAGSTVRVPLTISSARPGTQSASASLAAPYWNGVSGECVSYGPGRDAYVHIQTEAFNGFGVAAPGEAVYWQSYLFAYEGGAWHPYGAGWNSYTVGGSIGGGYVIIGGGDSGYSFSQAFHISSRIWTLTGVYVWTKRTGYHFAWVNNTGGGYGDVYSQDGYCYSS
jgi:hypothetical protein